jgi:hypothetical protein
MKKFTACECCFKQLYKENPWAALFWLDLVGDHIESRYLYYVIDERQTQYLEEKGFVLTHEDDSRVLFRLKGKQDDHFCIKPDDHNNLLCV